MKKKLCEIGEIIAGGTPSTKINEYWNGKISWITPKDLSNYKGRFISKGERSITEEGLNNSSAVLMPKNSILFTSRAPIGYVAIAEKELCTNQGFKSFVCDEQKCYYKYMYYWFLNNVETIKSKANGSTFQEVSGKVMKNIEIELPDMKTQINIGNILDTIDRKIELNNRINNNWYNFAINYLNSVASNDEVQVSEFGKIQGGYTFKSKDLKDERTKNRVIKIKNLSSEINADIRNSQFIDDEVALKIDKKFELQKGDVVIAMTGAELGKTGFIYGKDNYYLNQRVGVIKGKDVKSELYLKILMLSNNCQRLLNSKGYGSAQPNISTFEIESIMIKNITKENLDDFYKTIYPIYNKIVNNCEESEALTQIRDALLPKLMNGEIDIDNIKN